MDSTTTAPEITTTTAPTRKRRNRFLEDNDEANDTITTNNDTNNNNGNMNNTVDNNTFSLLVSPLPFDTKSDTRPDPQQPHKRVSRWTIANTQRENEIQTDLNPINLASSLITAPTFQIPSNLHLSDEQRDKVAILHNQIEDLKERMKNPADALQYVPERDRSPSPEPTYDLSGTRLNTRTQRFQRLCEKTRTDLIIQIAKLVPTYKTDGFKRERPFRNVKIPTDEFPSYNFSGLIIGPRGTTHKQMEAEYNCKVSIRGRLPNEVKHKVNEWSNDPPHVHVEGDDEENVMACAAALESLIMLSTTPDDQNEHKTRQLMELSRYNGTLAEVKERDERITKRMARQREITNYSGTTVVCNHCGSTTHLTDDCRLANNDAFAQDYLLHEQSLLVGNELLPQTNNQFDNRNRSTNNNNNDNLVMAPPRPRLPRRENNNDNPSSNIQLGGIIDLSSPQNIDTTTNNNNNNNNNPIIGSGIIPPPPPPNTITNLTSTSNNNTSSNNHALDLIGQVTQTPQGPLVMTPGNPILFRDMTQDQITRLSRLLVEKHQNFNSPFFYLLISMGIDPNFIITSGNVQMLNNNNNNNMDMNTMNMMMMMSNPQMAMMNNGNNNNNPQNVSISNPNNPTVMPPGGVPPQSTKNNNTNQVVNNTSSFQPPPPPGLFQPPPPPGVFAPPPPPSIASPVQSPPPPPTHQTIEQAYEYHYKEFWTQFRTLHNRDPTEAEWYQQWNVLLPTITLSKDNTVKNQNNHNHNNNNNNNNTRAIGTGPLDLSSKTDTNNPPQQVKTTNSALNAYLNG